jgi:hypothetical protein
LLETEGLPTEVAPPDIDDVVVPPLSEDEAVRVKLERFCTQLSLTKVERRDLANELKPYPKAAILYALETWHVKQCAASGKTYRYFLGIVRGESKTMTANTKKSGGLPPMKE